MAAHKIVVVTLPADSDAQADELANTLTRFLGDINVKDAQVFLPDPDLCEYIDSEIFTPS